MHTTSRLFLFIIFLSSFFANAQHDWCGSDEILNDQLKNNPNFALNYEEVNKIISDQAAKQKAEGSASVVRVIPVVFHIIYATEADNISVAQIKDGLRVLNEDFRRLNADTTNTRSLFKGVAADVEVEFRLAGLDPNGNCTDGITRTQSDRSLVGNNNVKNLINWDNDRYYNIWVTRNVLNSTRPGNVILGYSSFPQIGGQSFRDDGTVMRHDELGTIGTAVSDGRTLTHETGHYLSLLHPFEDNAGGTVGGCFRGDQVGDTPPVDVRNFGCNYSTNSCSNDNPDLPDQIENYMDYSNCVNMFTVGQKARMISVLTNNQLRARLVSSNNLVLTGVNNPPVCVPEPVIEVDQRVICQNTAVQFSASAEEGTPASYSWTFPGGTPASSSQTNPTVSYASPGSYDVILEATNSAGTGRQVDSFLIDVRASDPANYNLLYTQSFEGNDLPAEISIIDGGLINGDGISFELYRSGGSHQSQSLVLRSNPDYLGEFDEIYLPPIATANGNDLNLFFDHAFTIRQNDNTDRLEVFVSQDCGLTWQRRRSYQTNRLITATPTQSDFQPAPSEWTTQTINFSGFVQNEPILIKFVFENGGGNNFYIDNIRFGEGNDVSLAEFEEAHLELYPNPSKGQLNINYQKLEDKTLELRITDLGGRAVFQQTLSAQGDGHWSFDLDLPQGIYLVELTGKGLSWRRKLQMQ